MKFLIALLILGSFVLLAQATEPSARRERDYSFMTAEPHRSEVQLAQRRLTKFLARLNPQRRALLDQTPYVAVQAYELTAGEVPGLTTRLGKGSVSSTRFGQDIASGASVPVKFLLIFDSRNQQLAKPDGVLVTDTPRLNTVALFGGTHALYAGTGW
jgi:hypothetical protein